MDWSGLFDFLQWWTAGRAGVAAGGVGALAAAAAAISGTRTLKQARSDSRSKSRPMVVARFDKAPYTRGVADLVIQNYGPSIARNLRVVFDPPIQDSGTRSGQASLVSYLIERYKDKIGVLVPGVELRSVYWVSRGQTTEDGKLVNDEPTPDKVVVTIEYEGDDEHEYVDSFNLDLKLIKLQTSVESSASPQGMAKEALKQLKIIAGAMKNRETGGPTAL